MDKTNLKPEDYIGKMFEITFSSGRKDFVIIAGIKDTNDYRCFNLYYPHSMDWHLRSISGVMHSIKFGIWVEV